MTQLKSWQLDHKTANWNWLDKAPEEGTMGRELQKKRNRSSIPRLTKRRNARIHKIKKFGSQLIAQNWYIARPPSAQLFCTFFCLGKLLIEKKNILCHVGTRRRLCVRSMAPRSPPFPLPSHYIYIYIYIAIIHWHFSTQLSTTRPRSKAQQAHWRR